MAEQQYRIVIIEDHELTRDGLVVALKKSPHFTVAGQTDNGESGYQLVKETRPDCVLMDIGMPVMNGIEATRLIKQTHPEVKVLMLTSYKNGQEVYASLAAGADAYCLKDIKTDRLLQVIGMIMEGAIWLDPAIARTIMNELVSPPLHKYTASDKTAEKNYTELTERELEVLQHLVEGKSNKEIASEMYVSVHTVKAYVATLIQKLSVDSRTQAAVKALTEGIVPPTASL